MHSRPKVNQPKRSYHKKHGYTFLFFKHVFLLILMLILVGTIILVLVLAWLSRGLPDPNQLSDRAVSESAKIYDRTGQTLLYEVAENVKRTKISLAQVPDHVKWATIVTEDKNFYKHPGFSIKSMFRSLYVNVLTRSKEQGGSTITQQLIKNTLLTREKTYARKLKELMVSYILEKKFTKDQILEMYFNEVSYGSNIYGIEAASQSYFGKNTKDLTVAEGAILAALPKAPSYYSPFNSNRERLITRQHYVLRQLFENGYINEGALEEAKTQQLNFKIRKDKIIAPHFVMYVRELISNKYNNQELSESGLNIYTSLDLTKQKIAEEAIAKFSVINSKKYKAGNAALVALDPQTGDVLSMVGSVDFFDNKNDGNVNVALQLRQPGSSFKPIVYAVAFERGFTPETVLWDVNTIFKTDLKDYEPKNYDEQEHGPVSMRKALAGSLNIASVKTLYLAGINNVLDLAERMGYTSFKDRSRFGLSLVLGGGEVKLLEHTSAFGVFATEGVLAKPRPILYIKDKNGKVVNFEVEKRTVLSNQTSHKINSILADNNARSYIFGPQSKLKIEGRNVAVKTGTTNEWRDGWTIGYTPSLVAGVWVGNNDNKPMVKKADGVYVAAPIWNEFMTKALAGKEVEKFTDYQPVTNLALHPILRGEKGVVSIIKIDKFSQKLATELTPLSSIIETPVQEIHTILRYIDLKNPTSSIPPADYRQDKNYQSWEDGISKYLESSGYIQPNIPLETDDLHIESNRPIMAILSPVDNQTITNKQINVELLATASRGISTVEYYIDEKLVRSDNTVPQLVVLDLQNIQNGFHSLMVRVSDDIGNTQESRIDFNLLVK